MQNVKPYQVLLIIFSSFFISSFSHAKDSTIIVFDGSGSMWGQINGQTKIEIAREVMGTLINDWNEEIDLGLIAYGHRTKGKCDDIEVLFPVAKIDQVKIMQIINNISPKGKTPISESLTKAAKALRFMEDPATVILISDGEETCNADPCAVSKDLESKGINFTAHVIGFDIKENKKAKDQLKCIAENTGGEFYLAEDATSLKEALDKVKQEIIDPRPTKCIKYAEDAVKHEYNNIVKECGYAGKHWTTDYSKHFDWCMAESIDSTLPDTEHQAHITDLTKCDKKNQQRLNR